MTETWSSGLARTIRRRFAGLVHQVSDSLFGIVRRILRDPRLAEDIPQNALLTMAAR